MAQDTLTLYDLRRVLTESAGVSQGVDLNGDIRDVSFNDLGYDSIAVLEVAVRITNQHGIRIEDAELLEARTPRQLLDLINGQVQQAVIGGEGRR